MLTPDNTGPLTGPHNGIELIQQEIEKYPMFDMNNPSEILSFALKLTGETTAESSLYMADDYELTQKKADAMKKELGMEALFKEKTIDKDLEVSVAQMEDFIINHFPEGFLKKCLLGQIIIDTDTSMVAVMKENLLGLKVGGRFCVPNQKMQDWLNILNEEQQKSLKDMCMRAYSTSHLRYIKNVPSYKKYFFSPTTLFSQKFSTDHIDTINHLKDIPKDEKKEKYIFGTISHEIAHNVYNNLIVERDLESDWKSILDKVDSLTEYTSFYEEIDKKKDYNESFAEAVRLYITNPKYLESKFQEVFNFIRVNFPEIKV